MKYMKANIFLRKKGLNHDFKLKGSDFDGTLLELLNEYDNSNTIEFYKEDLKKVIGYMLYDLFELGLLNSKGKNIVNSTKEIPEDIIKEIGKCFNNYLKEKQNLIVENENLRQRELLLEFADYLRNEKNTPYIFTSWVVQFLKTKNKI